MRKKEIWILVMITVSPLLVGAGHLTVAEVSKYLVCQCGCANMVVFSCQCGVAGKMKDEISRRIQQGEDRKTILEAFAKQYGEKVIAEPSTEGFNISAWVVPFFALLAGILVIGFVLRRWMTTYRAKPRPKSGEKKTIDESIMKQIEEELDDME